MYILCEMQTTGNQTALVPTKTFADKNQAESAYHQALSAAAVSDVPVHAVVLLDEHGNAVKREFYEHVAELGE